MTLRIGLFLERFQMRLGLLEHALEGRPFGEANHEAEEDVAIKLHATLFQHEPRFLLSQAC